MSPGPLWRRALARPAREGAWSLLVCAAFLLTAMAGAADVLSVSAWRTAGVQRVLAAVPDQVVPRAAPVLRISGVPDPGPRLASLREQVDAVPGLGPGELTGVSFGDELIGTRLERYDGFAAAGTAAGGARVPARPVAVDDPGSVLVVTAVDEAATGDGLWLPTAAAAELGLRPGDEVTVGVEVSRGETEQTARRLAGTYEVGPDGATPADRPGATFWSKRAGRLPGDPGGSDTVALLVGEPTTVVVVANEIRDVLLWSLDAGLDPAVPTRTDLAATVRGVEQVQRDLAASGLADSTLSINANAVSGLPGLAAAADDITRRAATEARTPAVGSVVLGLTLVLAVSALGVARRTRELELLAGLGVRPPAVGGLAVLEVVPAALVGLVVGVPGALLAVRLLTGVPPEPGALRLAAEQAAVLVALGVLLHGLTTLLAAAAASRRGARHHAPRRGLPWRPALVVAAVAATTGLLAAPVGESRGLDLAVPVLLAAAVGALGATLLRRLAAGRAPSPAGGVASAGRHAGPARVTGARQVGRLVVRRRLAGAGDERLLVVTALATAFGLAVHVVAGQVLVERAVQDKVAVIAGAPVVVDLDAATQIDPDLPVAGYPRDVEAPTGDAVVFRDSGRLPGDRQVDVVVVDLDTIDAVAAWGHPGGPLDSSRVALSWLAEADELAVPVCPSAPLGTTFLPPPVVDPPPPDCPPRPPAEEGLPLGRIAEGPAPVVLVGQRAGLDPGDRTVLASPNGDLQLQVVGVVPAFPGLDPDLRTGLVATTGSYLPRLPAGDPRYAPDGQTPPSLTVDLDGVELWSTRPVPDVTAYLRTVSDVDDPASDELRVTTLAEAANRPAFVAVELVEPYLRAMAVLVLGVAVLALCLSVDRAAARARAGDLVLARIGLGRSGTRRLLAVEAVVLVLAGLLLGVLGWLLTLPLLPRLLEPEPSVVPLLRPTVVPGAAVPLLVATLVALVAAASVARAGTRAASEEQVLRSQD